MKSIMLILVVLLLAGCGADTMSAAATAGAIKKQEIEEGRKTMDRAQQKINAAAEQMRQSAQRAGEAGDNN
jgi:uncharacterized protein YceK